MRRWSPYNYTYDSPIRLNDPDGLGPTDHIFNTQGQLIKITPTGNNILVKTDEGQLVNITNLPINSKNLQTIANITAFYGSELGIPRKKIGVAPGPQNEPHSPAYTHGDDILINDMYNNNKGISSLLGNYYNMLSALFHEKEHRDKGQGFFQIDAYQHAEIYTGEIADATFKNTTMDFKKGILWSAASLLADSYNKESAQENDVEVQLNIINASISQFGLELVSSISGNGLNMTINLINVSKKNEKQKKKKD